MIALPINQIIHGDCLEVLRHWPEDCVAAVVSDPPYGINYHRGSVNHDLSSTGKRFSGEESRVIGDDQPFNPSPFLRFPVIAFTGAQHFYDRLPPGGSLHCWDKRGNYKPLDQADADVIWVSEPKVSRVFHLVWRGICRHAENLQPILHPTQKPVALMKWMIRLCEAKGVILDPYCGSGSTCVAAKQMGLPFIGIDISEEHCETARRRLGLAVKKEGLFQ